MSHHATRTTIKTLCVCLLGLAARSEAQGGGTATRPRALSIPAPREFRHHETIVIGYDEPSGFGSVSLQPMLLSDSSKLTLTALFVFKGRVLEAPPPRVSLGFVSKAASPRYASAASRTLRFTLDGGRQLRVGELFRTVDSSTGRVTETLVARLDTPLFLQLTSARRVIGRLGSTPFELREDQLEALRDFASRMSPATFRLANTPAAGGGAAAERRGWYDSNEVSEPAELAGTPITPAYPALPDSLRAERLVQFEYVVDTTGHVELTTLRGEFPTRDAAFIEALRAVASRWEFRPARKEGAAVRQRVRTQMVFHPPQTP